MKLPTSLTTVTPFSKIIALCLFVLLPFIGFAFGMQYQRLLDKSSYPESRVFTPPQKPTTQEETMTFSGKLLHFERPAPDIPYDYQLELNTPYIDNNNASGMSLTLLKIIVIPSSERISKQMQNALGKKVTIEGEWKWGYAESKIFSVSSIE